MINLNTSGVPARLGSLLALGTLSVALLSAPVLAAKYGSEKRAAEESEPAPPTVSGQVFTYPELNFRLTVPEKRYQPLAPENINPDATAIFYSPGGGFNMTVIAESVGANLMTTQGLVNVSQANLLSQSEDAEFSEAQPERLGDLDTLKYYSTARIGARTAHYIHWVAEHNGYIYQFIVNGFKPLKALESEPAAVLATMELIDGARIAGQEPGEKTAIGHFKSRLGYRLDLTGTGWTYWEDAEQDIWHPDLAGDQGDHSVFATVPVCFTDWRPKEHAMDYALLRAIGLDYPHPGYSERGTITVGDRQGTTLEYVDRNEDGDLNYRIHLFKDDRCALLVAVWSSLGDATVDKLSDELLAGLAFDNEADAMEAVPLAWFYNAAGLFYHEAENYPAALEGFRRAARIDPTDKAYINNAASMFNRLSRYQAGLNFMLSPELASIQDAMVLGWHGWFQYQLQDFVAAAESYRQGFALGSLSEDDLIAYIRSLIHNEAYQDARAVIDEHRPEQPGAELARVEAHLATVQGNYEQALAVLDEARERNLVDSRLLFERMDILALTQDYEEIVQISNQLIEAGNGSALAYHYRGDAQYKLERYLDAKESFEQALLRSPGDATVAEYLRFTQAQLGKGDSSSISTEIAPVDWPELTAPEQVSGAEEYDSYYALHLVAYHFAPDQPLKTTVAQRIKVRDRAGVRRFNTLTAEFNPLSEKLYVNRLLVRDETGQVVSELDRSGLYIGDSEDYDQATFGKVVRAPVAGLAPGYSIEFVYTTEGLSPAGEFQFERLFLSGGRPIGVSALYLEGELDGLLHNQTHTAPPIRGDNSLLWVAENPPVSQREPMQVDAADYLATVVLASKNRWPKAGEEYRERVRELIYAEAPELEPLVNKLTAGIPRRDQAARIAALAEYVQSTLTYKALEFGVRGYTPNTPTQILADRFGDCKDHSVLLWRLLREADIPAELALANLSGPVDPELPSIDQFDHMVVYLPEFRGGTFIDATNKETNLVDYTPSSLGNTWTLTLGERPNLVQVPEHSPSNISVQRDLKLLPEGELLIEEKVSVSAYFASGLRSHFKSIEARERLNWVQRFLGDGGEPVVVESLRVDNVFQPAKDLVLKIRYRVTPSSLVADSGAILDPAYWERYYLSSNLVHNRQTDFEIAYPLVFATRTTYTAPHLEQPQWQPVSDAQETSRFGKFQSRWQNAEGQMNLAFRYEVPAGRYGADHYSGYQKFTARALDVLQQPVRMLEAGPR